MVLVPFYPSKSSKVLPITLFYLMESASNLYSREWSPENFLSSMIFWRSLQLPLLHYFLPDIHHWIFASLQYFLSSMQNSFINSCIRFFLDSVFNPYKFCSSFLSNSFLFLVLSSFSLNCPLFFTIINVEIIRRRGPKKCYLVPKPPKIDQI